MDMILSQGTHLISFAVVLINNLGGVKFEIDKTLDLLSHELEIQEKVFNSWLKLQDFQFDVMVDSCMLPSRDMYIEQREALEHQMNTLEMLIKDIKHLKGNAMTKVRN